MLSGSSRVLIGARHVLVGPGHVLTRAGHVLVGPGRVLIGATRVVAGGRELLDGNPRVTAAGHREWSGVTRVLVGPPGDTARSWERSGRQPHLTSANVAELVGALYVEAGATQDAAGGARDSLEGLRGQPGVPPTMHGSSRRRGRPAGAISPGGPGTSESRPGGPRRSWSRVELSRAARPRRGTDPRDDRAGKEPRSLISRWRLASRRSRPRSSGRS